MTNNDSDITCSNMTGKASRLSIWSAMTYSTLTSSVYMITYHKDFPFAALCIFIYRQALLSLWPFWCSDERMADYTDVPMRTYSLRCNRHNRTWQRLALRQRNDPAEFEKDTWIWNTLMQGAVTLPCWGHTGMLMRLWNKITRKNNL